MQCATSVDPLWLAEHGPMFYSVKEAYETRRLKRKRPADMPLLPGQGAHEANNGEDKEETEAKRSEEHAQKKFKLAQFGGKTKRRFGL